MVSEVLLPPFSRTSLTVRLVFFHAHNLNAHSCPETPFRDDRMVIPRNSLTSYNWKILSNGADHLHKI